MCLHSVLWAAARPSCFARFADLVKWLFAGSDIAVPDLPFV